MDSLHDEIRRILDISLIKMIISSPRKADGIKKVTIRPVMIKGALHFQREDWDGKQVFHKNTDAETALKDILEIIPGFRQVQIRTEKEEISVTVSKKGKTTIKRKARKAEQPDLIRLSHNRRKAYLLEEGTPVPFLVDLGVMTEEGKIVRKRYDKFRQINRFLEFIEDILPSLPRDREVTVLDFGCGKSYLTFAMYYYLHYLKGLDIHIIGLDLKKKVIRDCSRLADKYGYDKLDFLEGDIERYEGVSGVDMVVTLHACDTATDYALYKAVRWGAEVILSVPCCQHELNGQLKEADPFRPLTDYGILKERFCALATDGIRGKLMEASGYDTQILEFIETEHTPKNLLIRAMKRKERREKQEERALKEVQALCDMFGFQPTLLSLVREGEMGE